jgi:hypothetical protein
LSDDQKDGKTEADETRPETPDRVGNHCSPSQTWPASWGNAPETPRLWLDSEETKLEPALMYVVARDSE